MDATLQGKKSLFRVQHPHAEAVYHARRSHRKSRSGCSTCKRRRVKCDETKPVCTRCQKHRVACNYGNAAAELPLEDMKGIASQLIERFPYLDSFDSTGYSMSLYAAATRIDELLQVKPGRARPGPGMDCLAALHHFQDQIQSSRGVVLSENWRPMVELSFSSPLLMHALIAAASNHLIAILPDSTSYKLIEAYHWHQATIQYAREISHVTQANMDILFSTCMLLTLNTFPLSEFNPRASFAFSNHPSPALNWLTLQSGLRHLLYLTKPWFEKSIWFDTFMASRGDQEVLDDYRPGPVGLHPGLAELCGIGEDTADENPYWLPLRILSPMLGLNLGTENLARLTNFMGRLLPPFFERLVRKETPALVVLAWWLGLMYAVDLWWVRKRVWSETVGICMFLQESGRVDARVRDLLEFPAGVCGYDLDGGMTIES